MATVSVILEATAHILVTEGYEHLNTNRVAERAGVSIGSLYQYFPNKQALLSALRQRHAQDMQSLVNELTEQALSQTLPQAIRTLVGAVGGPSPAATLASGAGTGSATANTTGRAHRMGNHVAPETTGLPGPSPNSIDRGDVSVASLVLVRLVDALIHATLTPDPLGVSPQPSKRKSARWCCAI